LNYSKEEIVELQNDPSFLDKLNEMEKSGLEDKNLVSLYDVLDSLLLFQEGNSERINKIYEVILEEALHNLKKRLENETLFSLENQIDHYTLRAIYEYGIDKYSKSLFTEAKELFIMLSILTDNSSFKGAMQIHLVAVLKEISLSDFIEEYIDLEELEKDEDSFFMLYFKDNANSFLHENSELIRSAMREVRELKL
jgi:hypothetical protein